MTFPFEFMPSHLEQIIGRNQYLEFWYNSLCELLPEYQIDSPLRVAAFIAQCSHESGGFNVLRENLNYRAQSLRRVFPKYFPTDELAMAYEKRPEMIANRVYANRMGNGPEESGDGYKFSGRGLIQLTGKNNYTLFAENIGMNIEEVPEYLETFEGAVRSACFFWQQNNLNPLADKGDILTLTKRINGGTIGLEDRIKYYNKALQVLGIQS